MSTHETGKPEGQGELVRVGGHTYRVRTQVVIGKGRLIAQMSVDDLVARSSQRFVRVRSPEIARLREALEHQGGQARPGEHRPRGEPVVPGTHHDDVPSGACLRASQHF